MEVQCLCNHHHQNTADTVQRHKGMKILKGKGGSGENVLRKIKCFLPGEFYLRLETHFSLLLIDSRENIFSSLLKNELNLLIGSKVDFLIDLYFDPLVIVD